MEQKTHHALVDEIASQVEDRLISHFTKWVIANLIVLILCMISAIAAFFDLKADVRDSLKRDVAQDMEIERIRDEHTVRRAELNAKLDNMRAEFNSGIAEINRYLRDHNDDTKRLLHK